MAAVETEKIQPGNLNTIIALQYRGVLPNITRVYNSIV